jgi:hypothetical protein
VRIILMLFCVATSLVACGGNSTLVFYDGERKPPSEVATIEIGNVVLMSIDSLERKYQAFTEGFVEVLPGQHTIGANYRSKKGYSRTPILITFDAKGGHNYLVKGRAGFKFWTSWIIDLSNDSLVAGSSDTSDKEHRGSLNQRR